MTHIKGVLILLVLLVPSQAPRAQTLTITTSSDDARRHFDQGRAAMLDIDFESARAHFDAAIAADADFALAHLYRAYATPPAQRAGHMEHAVSHAAHASADERALIEAVNEFAEHGEDGLDDVDAVAARFPDDAHVQYMAAVFNYQNGRLDTAEAQLERGIAADPSMGGAYNILGYVRMEQGDNAGAEEALREYIRLNPQHANPYDSLGEFFLRTGRFDEAEAQLRAALERDPEFEASLNNLAWVAVERANLAYEQAIARGDAEAIGALHTPGAVLLPPGSSTINGRAAIVEFWNGAFSQGTGTMDFATEEVVARDDMAYERGTYSFAAGGQSETGKFLAVWLRGADGVWRIHRDAWSSNAGPGGSEE
jgi:uncharacterized protein (TIGR02246 family)